MTALKDDGTLERPKRMLLSPNDLGLIMPRCPIDRLVDYAHYLSRGLEEAGATTVTRAAAFLGQIAHESDHMRHLEEIADGSAYEGRHDLGNTETGDGRRYKGRGPIQLTGRRNYSAASTLLGIDLVVSPELVAEPEIGCLVAAWYWREHDLNMLADGLDFRGITRRINGSESDLAPAYHARRTGYYHRALEVLGRSAKSGD